MLPAHRQVLKLQRGETAVDVVGSAFGTHDRRLVQKAVLAAFKPRLSHFAEKAGDGGPSRDLEPHFATVQTARESARRGRRQG
jgi:hypothetical protein